MTREELNRKRLMFQIQQNRNQLLKPDLGMSHSATNEFLDYRKRVAEGMRAKRDSEVMYFNITQANEANYDEMIENHAIIHAGITNDYIAKLDDYYGKGKPRYFYSRAEWDAYQRNQAQSKSGSQATNTRDTAIKKSQPTYNQAKSRINLSTIKGVQDAFAKAQSSTSESTKAQNSREAAIKKSQPTWEQAENRITSAKVRENISSKNNTLATGAQNAFAKSSAGQNTYKQNADYEKNAGADRAENTKSKSDESRKGREAAINNSSSLLKKDGGVTKAGKFLKNIKDATDRAKSLSANQSGRSQENAQWGEGEDWAKRKQKEREESDREDQRLTNIQKGKEAAEGYAKSQEDYYNDLKNKRNLEKEYKQNESYAGNAGADRASKEKDNARSRSAEDQSGRAAAEGKLTEDQANKNLSDASKAEKKAKIEKAVNAAKDVRNKILNILDKSYIPDNKFQKLERQLSNLINDYEYDLNNDTASERSWKNKLSKIFGSDITIKEEDKSEINKLLEQAFPTMAAKHSAWDDEEDSYAATMTPEQEYLAFRAKVEQGMKHFGLMRSMISVPINTRLRDEWNSDEMSHATPSITNEYIAKLDDYYGKGKPRYFYSQSEYDAYQRNQAQKKSGSLATNGREAAIKKTMPTPSVAQTRINNSLVKGAHDAYGKSQGNYGSESVKAQNGREAAIKKSQPTWEQAENRIMSTRARENASSANNSLVKGAQDAYNNSQFTPSLTEQSINGREAAIRNAYASKEPERTIWDKLPEFIGSQTGRGLEAETEGRGRQAYEEAKRVARDYELTKDIMADKDRWNKYNVYKGIKDIVLDRLMEENGLYSLEDIAYFPGGPEAFFDVVENEMSKEAKRALKRKTAK